MIGRFFVLGRVPNSSYNKRYSLFYSQRKVISIHEVLLILIFLACCAYADRGYKKFIPAAL